MLRNKLKFLSYDLVSRGQTYIDRSVIRQMKIEQNIDMKLESAKTSGKLNTLRNQLRMGKIWGQYAQDIRAHKSVIDWNIREGGHLGNRITLSYEYDLERLYKLMLIIAWPRKSPYFIESIEVLNKQFNTDNLINAKFNKLRNKNKNKNKIDIELKIGYKAYEELSGSYILINDWIMSESIEKNWTIDIGNQVVSLEDIIDEAREMKMLFPGIRWIILFTLYTKHKMETYSKYLNFIRTYLKIPQNSNK